MNVKQILRTAIHGRAAALPPLDGALEWINSEPLTSDGLRGNVVLVQFWTYSCINWLRTLPYVRAWAATYADRGLVTIGVHSPEFPFEKDVDDNVRPAAKDMGVDYPIAIDSDFAVWRAFDNQYWPALYLFDAQGQRRHQQFGEGGYEHSERMIQKLLAENGSPAVSDEAAPIDVRPVEVAGDWRSLQSPETYVGYQRGANFASPGAVAFDERRTYAAPGQLGLNRWALTGDWTIGQQAAVLDAPDGRIAYGFHARDLHLVMGAGAPGRSVPFRVRIDGQPPGTAHGLDVDDQGNGVVREPRLYQLVRRVDHVAERTFEIEFLDRGVQAYVFTFG